MKTTLAIMVAVALSACGSDGAGTEPSNSNTPEVVDSPKLSLDVIDTPYGPMQCIIYSSGYNGGVSCVPLGWDPTTVEVAE